MTNEDLDFDDELDPQDELEPSFVQDGPDLFGGDPEISERVDPDFAPASPVEPAALQIDEAAPGVEPAPISTDQLSAAQIVEYDAQPIALYRRYRPDDFRDLIGQEQVTEPLMRAIANGKVNHAYLFSGPRGCGKTTSARILARCLNCEQGPTPHPCGQCQSCRDLATGGPGSIDVIEIDAASHGLVEDARDLRERAYFAPVSSRFKVYIIDEAHMVTTHGFNALLKVVEEPPPHVKFIFATTEPDKVIGTIRSRTHHYPFRLVPPRIMSSYLEQICDEEGVEVERGVLPLVVRAGGGSVRDSLSVLDQLLGAAGTSGVSHQQAAALLGFTPDTLLDEMVDAFAAGDGRGVFATIDKVIEVGQDPRRFAEDLLQRMRDLVIVAQVPDAISSGLIDAAADQAERLTAQAAALGAGELTRAAEVIATGLTQMRGTTAPRLHLELICSRVLLPGSDVDERGVHARLDRLERRLDFAGSTAPAAESRATWQDVPQAPVPAMAPSPDEGRQVVTQGAAPRQQRPAAQQARPQAGAPAQTRPEASQQSHSASGALDTTEVRRLWPQILDEVKSRKRFTHALLSQNAQVAEVSDGSLYLTFSSAGVLDRFAEGGSADVLADSIIEILGAELKIVPQVDGQPSMATGSARPVVDGTPSQPAADPDDPEDWAERANPTADHPAEPTPPQVTTASDAVAADSPLSENPRPVDRPTGQRRRRPVGAAPAAADQRERIKSHAAAEETDNAPVGDDDPLQGASLDDETVEDSTLAASELLARELDAELIDDQS